MLRFIAQLIAFLIGGVPFGFIVAKIKAGIDIRQYGSGNIGATNVGRTLGLRYFFLVFVLDFLKGALPVAAAVWFQSKFGAPGSEQYDQYLFLPELVAFGTVMGHLFPIYLNFQGGKGVATSIGALIVLAPWQIFFGLIAWVLLVLTTRMVSVGSIGFALTFAISQFVLTDQPFAIANLGLTILVLVAAFLVIIRHRENIGRILRGTESKVRLPWAKA